jgi:hypothetical protein
MIFGYIIKNKSMINKTLHLLALICFLFFNYTNAIAQSFKDSTLLLDSSNTLKDTLVLKKPQTKGKRVMRMGFEVVDGDTIPIFLFDEVYLKTLPTEEEQKRYKKLVRDVKIALPYAKLAAFRLQMMEDNLSMMKSSRAKKKYINQCEKAIKEEFMNDLKNLTISQGKLLLKLIHRETGKTTFEILSKYQGRLEPLFWNSMAAMYGASTKDSYDVVLDYQIEEIIKKLEIE